MKELTKSLLVIGIITTICIVTALSIFVVFQLDEAETAEVKQLSVEQSYNTLSNWGCESCIHVIDVRTYEEYLLAHILINNTNVRGPVHYDYSLGFKEYIEQYDFNCNKNGIKEDTYFIYCKHGQRSDFASQWMIEHGFKNVWNMQGGLDAWFEAGYPMDWGQWN